MSLAARTGSVGPAYRTIERTIVVWRAERGVRVSDVAACDVQAATSPANQIARATTKSRSFAGGGTGQRGKPKRQSPSL